MSTQRSTSQAARTPLRFPSQGESLYLDVPPTLQTRFLNGNLQVSNSDNSYVYILKGGATGSNIHLTFPPLTDDDTIATTNFNNDWQSSQNFDGGANITGLIIEAGTDCAIADGVNIGVGSGSGTQIATGPNQMLGFFGAMPVSQPIPSSQTPNITDVWNALANLGLINAVAGVGGGGGGGTSGTVPVGASGIGGRWGLWVPSGGTSLSVGQGLLQATSTTSGTVGTGYVNNRLAQTVTSSAGTHNHAGMRSTNTICTMTNDPIVKFKVTMGANTNCQLELGFASSSSLGSSFNSCLNSSLHGCMIGFSDGDSSYSVITNNGGTTQTNNTGLASLQTTGTPTIFTLQYNHTTPSVTWTIQTGPTTSVSNTITTGNLPSNTSQMFVFCEALTGGTSATATLSIEDVEIMLGNDFNVF